MFIGEKSGKQGALWRSVIVKKFFQLLGLKTHASLYSRPPIGENKKISRVFQNLFVKYVFVCCEAPKDKHLMLVLTFFPSRNKISLTVNPCS